MSAGSNRSSGGTGETRADYREWAQSVRSEARRNLLAMRAERLARRQGGEVPAATRAASPTEDLPLSVSRQTADRFGATRSRPAAEAPPRPRQDTDIPNEADHEDAREAFPPLAERDALPEPEAEFVPEPEAENQSGPEAELLSPAGTGGKAEDAGLTLDDSPDPAIGAVPKEAVADLPDIGMPDDTPDDISIASGVSSGQAEDPLAWTEEALRDSPLMTLPGAGVGLVWLLQANGIQDLETLAAADVATLSEGLGLVGRLVDVGAWIAFARTASAASTGVPA